MSEPDIRSEGSVSQWNEGNLKSLRLHEAQELINSSKIDPLKKIGSTWNFNNWIFGITILYGEGQSKYAETEIEEVERIKQIIDSTLNLKPPFRLVSDKGMGHVTKRFIIDYPNWENLRKLIDLYEKKIKYFNDHHGLSTRNVDYDLEGL